MEFEWDEAKRMPNLAKHGLDFLKATVLFEGRFLCGEARSAGSERRWLATGSVDDDFVTVIFTYRGEKIRIISMRSARDEERRRYQELHG